MSRPIFVPAVGQYDNIGDIILRRPLLNALRAHGPLHVYVGNAPAEYSDGLQIQPEDRLYRSFARWYASAVRNAARGGIVYAFKPGELQMSVPGLKEHVSVVPLLALSRMRGGRAVRVGAGSRNFSRWLRPLFMPSVYLSDLSLWRDSATRDFVKVGTVIPDLAFREGSPSHSWPAEPDRDLLVVSMRGDRTEPPEAWFTALKDFAAAERLNVIAVTQVERDDERSRLLAARLGGSTLPWGGQDHPGQERALRETYRHARLVVSDRLHVLIAASTEGAATAALQGDGSRKISRHFDAIGDHGVSLDSTTASREECERFLRERLRRADPQRHVSAARAALAVVERDIGRAIRHEERNPGASSDGDGKHRVIHVGRAGAVAGGMSQVVNGYLATTFARSRTELLQTRDGSRGVHGVLVFMRALWRFMRLNSDANTTLVVHLSQGGSFFREGVILRLARLRGFGCVAQLHGSSFVKFAEDHPRVARYVLGAAHVIHVLSPKMMDAVVALLPTADVRLIPNGVERGRSGEKRKTAVFGGAVSTRKGVDVLIDAWDRSGAVERGWELIVAGPVREPRFEGLQIGGVTFAGQLAHPELMQLLETSSIAVLPSRDEAMPLFILEALARRNCVIASEVGGIPDVLAGGAGVLVPPGDARSLTEALTLMTGDDATRREVSEIGWREFQRAYDAAVVTPRLEQLWTDALTRALQSPSPAATQQLTVTAQD
jgi:glycosyltransferase involved in cell wall biosynthesis